MGGNGRQWGVITFFETYNLPFYLNLRRWEQDVMSGRGR